MLLTFLEPFNEYDREERCAELFGAIDPNDAQVMAELFEKEFFHDSWYGKTPLETKKVLADSLICALREKSFDFGWLIEVSDGTFGLPSSWKVGCYRTLFEIIYAVLYVCWQEELALSGHFLPAPENLKDMV